MLTQLGVRGAQMAKWQEASAAGSVTSSVHACAQADFYMATFWTLNVTFFTGSLITAARYPSSDVLQVGASTGK